MSTKKQRAALHAQINDLTHGDLEAIVRQQFPKVKGPKIDVLAKQIVAGAHRQVSPRRMQRG